MGGLEIAARDHKQLYLHMRSKAGREEGVYVWEKVGVEEIGVHIH